jgi:hypothetical protein
MTPSSKIMRKMPTLNSAWEVAIAYFGTNSLYDVVTEKYGYQENFPNDDEPLSMPEEVYKLIRDQDQDGEFFDQVSSLPLDEDIQTSASPAHQEENMMSYNPFENFDDALFHDCGNEENCQKDLDEVSLAEGLNETLLSTFPFEENEVIQSCEEVINSYDADEFMEQPSDIVDDHIDDFIQVGRRRWDVGCFIIDRDPIYDIEGSSQEKGLKFHLQRTGLHACMIQMFGNLVMIWLQICSAPSRMTCRNILRVIFSHPLIHTLLRMQICSMRIFNHCAQILIDTRSWPAQSSLRSTLPNKSTFMLRLWAGICRQRRDVS